MPLSSSTNTTGGLPLHPLWGWAPHSTPPWSIFYGRLLNNLFGLGLISQQEVSSIPQSEQLSAPPPPFSPISTFFRLSSQLCQEQARGETWEFAWWDDWTASSPTARLERISLVSGSPSAPEGPSGSSSSESEPAPMRLSMPTLVRLLDYLLQVLRLPCGANLAPIARYAGYTSTELRIFRLRVQLERAIRSMLPPIPSIEAAVSLATYFGPPSPQRLEVLQQISVILASPDETSVLASVLTERDLSARSLHIATQAYLSQRSSTAAAPNALAQAAVTLMYNRRRLYASLTAGYPEEVLPDTSKFVRKSPKPT